MATHFDTHRDIKALQEQSAPGKPASGGHGGIPTMHVKVYSPLKVYFDEEATSISAVNQTGAFDILPQHHRFITLLEPCELVVGMLERTTPQRIKISGGLMHVKADMVTVFLDV